MLNPALFDPKEPLVTARFATVYGKDRQPGDVLPVGDNEGAGELPVGVALRLWLSGQAVYKKDYKPTPAESAAEEAQRLVEMDDLGGGWFLIRAPWLGQGEKVQGREAAEERRAEIAAKGDTKGVTVTGGEGGWYAVSAPWLDEPVKVQGKEAAAVEEAMLIQDGPPEGWAPETEEAKAARLQAAADKEEAELRERQRAEQAELDAAEAKRQEEEAERQRQAAEDAKDSPTDFTVEEAGPNGYYRITGPGLEEPLKVRGKAAADAKAQELRDARAAIPDVPEAAVSGAEDGESEPPVPGPDSTESTAGSAEPEPKSEEAKAAAEGEAEA